MNANRRQVLLRAIFEELAKDGYDAVTPDRACSVAGVSAEEFAAEFGDTDGALFAAYEELSKYIVERTTAGCATAEPWPERVRTGLAALLEVVAAEPQIARAMTRAFPSIRPSAYQRYVALLSRFVPFMQEGREYSEAEQELPGEVELLAVGSAEAIIFDEVDAGRAEKLPRMLPEILFAVLVPFLGPDRAVEEMRSAAAIL